MLPTIKTPPDGHMATTTKRQNKRQRDRKSHFSAMANTSSELKSALLMHLLLVYPLRVRMLTVQVDYIDSPL